MGRIYLGLVDRGPELTRLSVDHGRVTSGPSSNDLLPAPELLGHGQEQLHQLGLAEQVTIHSC